MIPIAANQFDLSVGYLVGLSHILVIGLQYNYGFPWYVAIPIVLVVGAFFGSINGVLVAVFGIDSFIATLGLGTVIYGLSIWYTGGAEIVLPKASTGFASFSVNVLGIPVAGIYLIAIAAILFFAFKYLPVGRHMYVVGANPRVARLTGLSPGRYVFFAFVAAGVLVAFAGVLLGSSLDVGDPSVGPEYLLPAFAACFLGATAFRPGRVNVLGTVTAVFLIGVVVAGLEEYGVPYYVTSIFDGAILIVAIALSVYARRRRQRAKR
jgi:ribose transport system permease protein